ncbi:MAG: aminotransferase class I/II-fold pyridoxal phosphate-dependent enzyme [Kiritimatiellae bacterium]|nr:aminotransferase class I/II-fold pyridoxal phosphate-dependent enzyme [Kiritimatiellia bacterium]
MNKLALQLNKTLGTAADFLSPAGRRMYFPYGGILGQGAEAKSCEINATVGMAFEEDGSPLVMDCFRKAVALDKRAFLYAGSFGLPKLREAWRAMEFVKNPSLKGKAFSNPVVTNALTHGIRICAELFAGPSDTLVCPDLFWDNYELIFKEAVGCKIERFNTFKKGAFDADAMKKALLAPGKKKILILNFPNNPTGYTATLVDAKKIVSAVKAAAAKGKKIVVLCDDAYFGLVYEKGVHEESLFAEFSDLHRNVLAVKLDGTTKEDYVWGLRVGFISFAFKGATADQLKALEAKAAGDVRSGISNVTSIGQHLAVRAFEDSGYAVQKREKFSVLKRRYNQIRVILKAHPEYRKHFEPMPFNSGYFMCVKPIGVDAEKVRRHLVEKYSVGTIVLSGLIRLAFSTVPMAKLDKLFASVDAAIADLTTKNHK